MTKLICKARTSVKEYELNETLSAHSLLPRSLYTATVSTVPGQEAVVVHFDEVLGRKDSLFFRLASVMWQFHIPPGSDVIIKLINPSKICCL